MFNCTYAGFDRDREQEARRVREAAYDAIARRAAKEAYDAAYDKAEAIYAASVDADAASDTKAADEVGDTRGGPALPVCPECWFTFRPAVDYQETCDDCIASRDEYNQERGR